MGHLCCPGNKVRAPDQRKGTALISRGKKSAEGHLMRPRENGVEHGLGHPPGECVLLTRVVAADEEHGTTCRADMDSLLTPVPERRPWPWQYETGGAKRGP